MSTLPRFREPMCGWPHDVVMCDHDDLPITVCHDPCPHIRQHFDRTLCAPPCDTMHYYCSDCGEVQDYCAHEANR